MLKFKNESDFQYWPDVAPKLKEIILKMDAIAQLWGIEDLVITSIVRSDESTHNQQKPYRFVDVRSKNFPEKRAQELRQIINLFYPYGLNSKGKPTDTIIDLDHGTEQHYHVQVKL